MKKLLIALLLLPFAIQAQTWSTVGIAGFSDSSVALPNVSIAIDGTGTPFVVYADLGTSGKATVKKYNGTSWVTVGSAGFSAGGVLYTSITMDGSGTPYVVYEDGGNSNKATVMKYNGTSWVTVGSAGFSPLGDVRYTSIAIDGSGTPYVVFADYSSGDGFAWVMKYNGASWVTVGSPDFSAGAAQTTTIAIDGSGTPYVFYSDYATFIPGGATVMKYNGTSWVTVGSAGFSVGEADWTSIAIDGSGMPYVAYEDVGHSEKATVMKYNGASWVTVGSAAFSASFAEYTSIAINGSGTPYVVYQDASTSSLKATVMKYNGAVWTNVGSANFSAGEVVYTSIAIDASGTPYVAYSDFGNSQKATVMKFSSPTSPITGIDSLCVGATTTLSDITSGGAWSSSNASVATVGIGTGIVSGIALGTTIISYTVSGSSVTVIVTVNPLPNASSISGSSNVCVGSNITLTDGAIGGVWVSSNTTIASVSSTATVTGITAGIAVITYSVTNSCGTAVAIQTVTVNPLPNSGSIIGSSSVCVGSSITLTDGTVGGVWVSSNTTIATVSSTAAVTGITAGIAVISYSVTNSCGTTAATQTVTVISCPTGVKNMSNPANTSLSVFPNPNNGTFTINLSSSNNEDAKIIITNLIGEKVKDITVTTNKEFAMRLDAPGMYFVIAITMQERQMAKVVVQ